MSQEAISDHKILFVAFVLFAMVIFSAFMAFLNS